MPNRYKGLNSADVDFEGTWRILEQAFKEIHEKNASALSFEELYRNAYKIVLKKKGEELYNKVAQFEARWLSETVKERVVRQLTAPLLLLSEGGGRSLATSAERRVAGEGFLRALKQSWEDHQTCMSMLTDVLMYMVRYLEVEEHESLGLTFVRRTVCIAPIIDSRLSTPKPWASSAIKYFDHPSDRTRRI